MEDKRDIDALFRLYYRPMCLYAAHYLDDDEAEDVVQEAFKSLWEKMRGGDCPSSPRAYLAASVRNRCIDILRGRKAHPVEALPTDLTEPDPEVLSQSFDEARIWDAIARLPKGRRRMFLMHRRDGMKYSEIALRLHVSERTVRNQISRALKYLRASLKEK